MVHQEKKKRTKKFCEHFCRRWMKWEEKAAESSELPLRERNSFFSSLVVELNGNSFNI